MALHWAVAQGTSLRNMTISVGSATSALFIENGGGGFIGDLSITGGDYGMMIGAAAGSGLLRCWGLQARQSVLLACRTSCARAKQAPLPSSTLSHVLSPPPRSGGQQWTLRGISITGARTAGIQLIWNWVFVLQNITIAQSPMGIIFRGAAEGSLVLLDSAFTDCEIGVATDYPLPLRGLVLDRVTATRVANVSTALAGNPQGVTHVRAWRQGTAYAAGKAQGQVLGLD